MAEPTIDSAPTTSYSDPIYDRLEALSQRVRRARWVIITAIVVAVILALVLRSALNNRPEAVSAVAFIKARTESGDARTKALEAMVADQKTTPFFRAKASLELCQEALVAGKPADAKTWVSKASEAAKLAQDDELSLAVRLSEGAVAEDSGELDAALGHYSQVQSAGSKSVTHYLLGVYGAARVEKAQGKVKEAMERLEPVISRSDEAAKDVLPMLQSLYWSCKRAVEGEPTTTAEPKKADPATLLPAQLPAAPAPAAPAATTEAAPAPAPAAEAPAK